MLTSTEAAAITVRDDIPAGFEDVAAPAEVVVDVFFGERNIGTFMATVTPETVTFHEPETLAAAVPGGTGAPALLEALTRPMTVNSNRRCLRLQQADCGTLKPDDAGIIYNEERFQATLFVHPRHLRLRQQYGKRYLPPPQSDGSALLALSGAASGGGDSSGSYTLRGDSTVGYRRYHLNTAASMNSEGVLLDTMAASHQGSDIQTSAGLLPLRGTQLLDEQDVLGLSLARSLNTRLDLEQTSGSLLPLFLPRPARVDILQDGQLLSSRFYEAGNVLLDTQELPYGAYSVTLQINESGGQTRTEIRFYRKTSDIAPLDTDLWHLQAGWLRRIDGGDENTLPAFTRTPALKTGFATRISDSLGVGSDVTATTQDAGVESNLFWFADSGQVDGAVLATARGGGGVTVNGYGTAPLLPLQPTVSFTLRQLWSGDDTAQDALIAGDESLFSLTGDTIIGEGRLGLRSVWQESSGSSSYAYGPFYRRPLARWGLYSADVEGSVMQTESETLALVQLRLYGVRSDWGLYADSGMEYQQQRWQQRHQLSGTWNDGERWPQDDITLRATASQQNNRQTGQLDGDWRGSGGYARAAVDQSSDSALRYGSSFLVNVMGDRDGLTVGGHQLAQSAVTVSLTGAEKDTTYAVVVDSQERGRLQGNGTLSLPLAPYRQYQVHLRPVAGALAAFDSKPRTAVLYPGNIVRLHWEIEPLRIVLGRLVDAAGKPLAGYHLLSGRQETHTDDNGFFQLDVTGDTITVEHAGQPQCELGLPADDTVGDTVMLDEVVCS